MNRQLALPLDDDALIEADSSEALAAYLRQKRAAIAEAIKAGAPGLETARAHSDLVDSILRRTLQIACGRAGGGAAPESIPVAVVATGGYGRREMCLYSDVDLTFVPHRDGDPLVDRVIKEMFNLVMRVFIDSNGVEVGYAYRLLEDCRSLDHQTTCGLLDARLVAGSTRVFLQLEDAFREGFHHAEFIFDKIAERERQRHEAGDTARVVEPNVKVGVGGLRDLQTAVWLIQAVEGLDAAKVRGERCWEALERFGGLTRDEVHALAEAKELLFRIRNALHAITGAERDQLVVTRQEEVAHVLGFVEPALRAPEDDPPVELFMRRYFQAASLIDCCCTAVRQRVQRGRIMIGIGLDCVEGRIEPASDALDAEDPSWMLWVCEVAQRYGLEISHGLRRRMARLTAAPPTAYDTQMVADTFTRILGSAQPIYPSLSVMAETGILAWLVPEFAVTLDLIPYDPSHDYTVGQHSLRVVRNLDTLKADSGPEETRDYRMIMQHLPNPEQLYLAALLHDAGKAVPNVPHSDTGADIVTAVCARLGWSETATANARFLVQHHLLMDQTSTLLDLNQEETIRDFVSVVNDLDRLNMLYLLTWADTSAVGAGIWTQVKARFLRDLLHRAERLLAGEESEGLDAADLARIRRSILRDLSLANLPPEEVEAHVAGMPPTYILNTSLEEMTLHLDYVRRARQGEPVVDFVDPRDSTYTELTVCVLDDPEPGLLSKITGVLYACDLNVHSAQVFTRRDASASGASTHGSPDIAIDRLYVDFRGRQLTPGKRKEVATSLREVLTGASTVADLLARKRKQVTIGGPVESISINNRFTDRYGLVQVECADAQPALYRVSGALSSLGWDIISARVTQIAGNTVASFYVTGTRELSEAEARERLARVMPAEPHTPRRRPEMRAGIRRTRDDSQKP